MRRQLADAIDTPAQAAERAGTVELQAVLDRALQLPASLRLGFLLRALNGVTKGNA